MSYYYPFGETVHPLVQQDRTPKKVFVLGVYVRIICDCHKMSRPRCDINTY